MRTAVAVADMSAPAPADTDFDMFGPTLAEETSSHHTRPILRPEPIFSGISWDALRDFILTVALFGILGSLGTKLAFEARPEPATAASVMVPLTGAIPRCVSSCESARRCGLLDERLAADCKASCTVLETAQADEVASCTEAAACGPGLPACFGMECGGSFSCGGGRRCVGGLCV